MITGTAQKREKRKSLEETLATTAQSVIQAISSSKSPSNFQQIVYACDKEPPEYAGVSPGKVVDIRGKSYGQLAVLKQLHSDGILDDEEFYEQKRMILTDLKKLK